MKLLNELYSPKARAAMRRLRVAPDYDWSFALNNKINLYICIVLLTRNAKQKVVVRLVPILFYFQLFRCKALPY